MKQFYALIALWATIAFSACTTVVEVEEVRLDNYSISLTPGQTREIKANVFPEGATYERFTWNSSNSSVVSVSDGTITALQPGESSITASANGVSSKPCKVVVKAIPVSRIDLNSTSLSLIEEESFMLTATVYPTNATYKGVEFVSSNTSVATVTSGGSVYAVKEGTGTITCRSADGNASASCTVTVKSKKISVTGVSLDKTNLTMTEGDTQTLTATVSPSNATDKSVTWTSNNTAVATVSSSGVVTAKSPGAATITVKTNDGGKTATCRVTVTPITVTGVYLNKYSLSMYENDSETLIATVLPSNATNKNITWSSNNTAVATVSSSGVVTAKSSGTATITVKTNDGGKTATCSVTVNVDPYGAVDLGLSVKWSAFNYGASSVTATGGYYMWGDPSGTGQPGYFTPPNISSISGTQYDIVRKNWGGNWRIPTRGEIIELYSNCSWTSSTVNGVAVLKVTGKNGASIYLPYTGFALPDDGPVGTITVTEKNKVYMMSAESDGSGMALIYHFTNSGAYSSYSNASYMKFPIRPVR